MEDSTRPSHSEAGQRRSNPRPESTLALDFSSALDGAFNMNGDLLKLGTTVEEKKQTVKSQSQELEELEARLKATEDRLKEAGIPTQTSSGQQEASSAPRPAASHTPNAPPHGVPSRLPPRKPGANLVAASIADRAPTPMDPSRNETMPGALPETPSERQPAADYYNQRRS